MPTITFFYRHPDPIYYSIEGLFGTISAEIDHHFSAVSRVRNVTMPRPSSLKNVLGNIAFTRKNQSSVNHITGDIHYAILGCRKRNVNILTVHDCVSLHKYSGLRYQVLKWLWFVLPVRKADVVTVISENTARELIRFTGCPRKKIRVVPNFIDPAFRYVPAAFRTERPTALFIGTTPNKNLEKLIEGMSGLPVRLEIVGQLRPEQIRLLESNGIEYRQSAGLSKEEMLAKYRECDLVAFPSTYEGFGLPILEAQATGRPVLTSNRPPMKDVAADGACLVDPDRPGSIRQGLLAILEDRAYREDLVAKGLQNVQRYSVEKVAGEYADIYRSIIEKKGLCNGRSTTK